MSTAPVPLIRPIRPEDLDAIVEIFADREVPTGRDYWRERIDWFGTGGFERFFLAAELAGTCVGTILGEVRPPEFGATRGGAIFAIGVARGHREDGIGTALFNALCAEFARAGVMYVRAMVPKQETMVMAFLRSQGMTAGSAVQMAMELGKSAP